MVACVFHHYQRSQTLEMTLKALLPTHKPSSSQRAAAGASAALCHYPQWGFYFKTKCQRIMFSCCVSVDKPGGFNCSCWQPAHCNLSSWQQRVAPCPQRGSAGAARREVRGSSALGAPSRRGDFCSLSPAARLILF